MKITYESMEERIYSAVLDYFWELMEARKHHTETNVFCYGKAAGKMYALIDLAVESGMTEDYAALIYRKARKSYAVTHNLKEGDL